MNRTLARLFLFGAAFLFAPLSASAVTIDTVPVGNAGNAGEVQSQGTFGAVAYDYRIGTTEVTNAQYAEFLNAKAASDPLGLYHGVMASNARGGITQSGSSGSYTYVIKPNMGNKPANWVTWFNAIRFANWLHNGQGAGDTEIGAYTLLGGTPTPSNYLTITRNAGARWFLTSEDEWYKAAYYDPTLNDGAGGYWDYATGSNTAPTVAVASSVGDISNPGTNVANYISGADWNGLDGNVTTVGSAGSLSESFYGTSDQTGNVMEWNESLISDSITSSTRSTRGGSWQHSGDTKSAYRGEMSMSSRSANVGFRVATIPEPSTVVLAAIGLAGLAACGWRRHQRGVDLP